jgi:hypothetical protein
MVFYRPDPNYVLPDLPNSTRCQDITDSTPNNAYPAKYLDIDFAGAYAGLDNLQLQINGIAAGILPGSEDPLNNNKAVIKDPNGTISFVFISDENVLAGGLSTVSFAANSVNSNILGNGSVITAKILDRAVTQNKLALLSVGSPQIINDSITNEKIHDVDGSKINDGSIPNEKHEPNSITNDKIHDVDGSKINDGSIGNSKLSLAFPPYEILCSGTSNPASIQSAGPGVAGQVATSNGPGALFTWQLPTQSATKANQIAANSTTVYTNPSVQQHHPSSAKFWCMFNGTTPGTNVPSAGYNVVSITRISAGIYRINYIIPFTTNNYCISFSSSQNTFPAFTFIKINSLDTNSCTIETVGSNGSVADCSIVCVTGYGVQ